MAVLAVFLQGIPIAEARGGARGGGGGGRVAAVPVHPAVAACPVHPADRPLRVRVRRVDPVTRVRPAAVPSHDRPPVHGPPKSRLTAVASRRRPPPPVLRREAVRRSEAEFHSFPRPAGPHSCRPVRWADCRIDPVVVPSLVREVEWRIVPAEAQSRVRVVAPPRVPAEDRSRDPAPAMSGISWALPAEPLPVERSPTVPANFRQAGAVTG